MKDNFSEQAGSYARYRPRYPENLFAYIMGFVKEKNCAWDCGTGNGQSAQELCKVFDTVIATDISQAQLDNAFRAPNILYSLQPAEKTSIATASADLITVSQALHWFKFDAFYAEVNRVAKPGAMIAAWTYSLLRISAAIDAVIRHYHDTVLGKYWDAERKYVDEQYRHIPFPYARIATPVFSIEYNWNIHELEGYLHTWSALQKYIRAKNDNPVDAVIKTIKPLWGTAEKRTIIFPLHLLLAPVNGV